MISKPIEITSNDNFNYRNKLNEQQKNKDRRSKTPEEKKIDDIKSQFFQKAKENIPRKREFSIIDRDNRISNPIEPNSQQNIIRILTMKNPVNIFYEDEDEEEEDKDEEKNLIETQKIAMNLFEWLILYCENDKNFSEGIFNIMLC